jgi:hypothetical protein
VAAKTQIGRRPAADGAQIKERSAPAAFGRRTPRHREHLWEDNPGGRVSDVALTPLTGIHPAAWAREQSSWFAHDISGMHGVDPGARASPIGMSRFSKSKTPLLRPYEGMCRAIGRSIPQNARRMERGGSTRTLTARSPVIRIRAQPHRHALPAVEFSGWPLGSIRKPEVSSDVAPVVVKVRRARRTISTR